MESLKSFEANKKYGEKRILEHLRLKLPMGQQSNDKLMEHYQVETEKFLKIPESSSTDQPLRKRSRYHEMNNIHFETLKQSPLFKKDALNYFNINTLDEHTLEVVQKLKTSFLGCNKLIGEGSYNDRLKELKQRSERKGAKFPWTLNVMKKSDRIMIDSLTK